MKREVSKRDEDRCAFVAATGRRCEQRTFLEFHHVQPFAMQGPATVGNISLRCRRHNQYEADLIFGSHGVSTVSESRATYGRGYQRSIRPGAAGFPASSAGRGR